MPPDNEAMIVPEDEQNPYAAPLPVAGECAANAARASGVDEMSPELLDELQRVANYRQMHKRLRTSGIGSVFFGVIAIAIGVKMLRFSDLNLILVGIGVFLLIEGLWLIVRPAPIGVILDGIALILVGTWNIAVQILNAAAGHPGQGFWPILGIFQILWGASLQSLLSVRKNAPSETGAGIPQANRPDRERHRQIENGQRPRSDRTANQQFLRQANLEGPPASELCGIRRHWA